MGAKQTIRRALLAVCLPLLSACHAKSKPAERRAPPQLPRGLASAVFGDASAEQPRKERALGPLPSAVVQTLRSLREQRLEIAPPTVQSALLSFGTARLLQASVDKATFRDSKQGDVITEASIGAVRAVAHGSDGALFAVGTSGGTRLEPRAKVAKPFAHVTFLPGSQLLPDLEQPSHFFVYYPEDSQLIWYPFQSEPGKILPIEASFRLEGCREPMAQLRDGAIVCRTKAGFLRQAPRGSRAEFSFPASDDPPVRLLAGMRLDEFFAVSKAGEVIHLRLAGGLAVLARFRLPAPPYAATANTEALAFVLVSNPQAGQPRRWSLLVTNFDGRPRFERELPVTLASADEDWLSVLLEDKNLAISGFEPLVAVGGPKRVTVWDYAQARELFSR
ncbi:MAG TPA: hypothetical protein VJV79_38545 [Polyangiaceae bacterium]|nr:hypothetical protein [Polyangiaceae bacterium]